MSDFDENKTRFTEENTATYNASLFAIKAKKGDVFSEESINSYKKYLPCISMLDDRIMLLPTGQIEPSFYLPNKLYYKTFLGRHRDCEMPVVMCVSKTSLADMYDAIYGQGATADTKNMVESLVSHTMTQFSMAVPEKVDLSGYLEGTMGSDDVLLVYGTVIDIIHRLANDDFTVVFTKETMCTDVTLGSLDIKAISIFTGEKKSIERYTPPHPECTKMMMGTGNAVMKEFQYILRMALKFGKGDAGIQREYETESNDRQFESEMLTLIAQNQPSTGPGSLGLIAGYFSLMGLTNTITKMQRKYDIDTDHFAVWSMFVQINLGNITAMTVSNIVFRDKGLRYYTKSNNPLTNLQLTASRESRTFCGLVLYLARLTCTKRSPKDTISIVVNRSKECHDCNSGENCAMTWACLFTDRVDLKNSLLDPKKKPMTTPSSTTFDQLFVSEFNDQASVLGSVGTTGASRERAGKRFVEACETVMNYMGTTLNLNENSTSKEAVEYLGQQLIDAQRFINNAEHRVHLINRGECTGSKLETVLTDSDGGVPKMSLGLLSVPVAKSKVLTYLIRIAASSNYKISDFIAKPSQGLSDAMAATASKNMGVYSSRMDQDQVTVKAFFLHPTVLPDTEEVCNINSDTKNMVVNVPGVAVKTTNKYKMLNGIMKPIDDCVTTYGGGMDFGAVTPTISPAQRSALRSSINWVLMKAKPNFNSSVVQKSIDNLITQVLANPMGQFNDTELKVWEWTSFRTLFVMGALMLANGFQIKSNNYYNGMTVPKFAALLDSSNVEMEPLSHRFLSTGPTMVYARTHVESFTGKPSGELTRFVTCSMSRFNPLKQLIGRNMMSLNNTTMVGVYLPLKSNYRGSDFGFDLDGICSEISSMSELSKIERCERFSRNTKAFVAKIRDINNFDETVEITFDHVHGMFKQYSAEVLLDDADLAEMAAHITESDYLCKVCRRVSSQRYHDQTEDDSVDFHAIMNKSLITTASENRGMDGEISTASLAEFTDN